MLKKALLITCVLLLVLSLGCEKRKKVAPVSEIQVADLDSLS